MKRSVLVFGCCATLMVSACGVNHTEPNTPDGGGSTPDGGGVPDGGGGVDPVGTVVTGKVLPGKGGASRSLSVLIPGGGRLPVNVDASGNFSVMGVTPPYDLIIADKAQRNAVLYQGLTLSSPSFTFDSDSDAAATYSGRVAGTVTGGSSANQTQVAFVSASGTSSLAAEPSGSYSLEVSWDGANTQTGTLYAFQSQGSGYDPPTRYTGAGQRDNVTLTANGTLSGQGIALSAVTNSSLAGSVSLPANYGVSLVSVGLAPKPEQRIDLFADTSGRSTFSYAVPQFAASTFSLQVFAQENNKSSPDDEGSALFLKRGLSAGATNVSVSIQAAPRQDKPAQEATGVARGTVFSWSAYSNGVHLLQFQEDKSNTPTPYTLKILTRAVQTSLPDLSPLGINLTANTRHVWLVQGFGPVTTVDALVGLLAKGDPVKGGTEDFSSGTSALRTFTTAASP